MRQKMMIMLACGSQFVKLAAHTSSMHHEARSPVYLVEEMRFCLLTWIMNKMMGFFGS